MSQSISIIDLHVAPLSGAAHAMHNTSALVTIRHGVADVGEKLLCFGNGRHPCKLGEARTFSTLRVGGGHIGIT